VTLWLGFLREKFTISQNLKVPFYSEFAAPTPAVYSQPWMKRIVTALVLIPLVLLLVFIGPKWLVTLTVAAVAILAAWEFLDLANRCGATPPRMAVMVAIVGLFAAVLLSESIEWMHQNEAVFGILSLGLLIYCTFSRPMEDMMASATTAIFCLFYVGLTLTSIPMLMGMTNGPSLIVFLLFAVWAGDIAALYIGRKWGRHKLAPRLSPNKTWEGTLASVTASILVTGILQVLAHLLAVKWEQAWLSYPEAVWYWILLAVLVNAAAQVGDLAESALKRSAGVKDSGNLLPGHGGMLDRIDALLLAAPVMWYMQLIHLRF
jgi:phosphatidate cytidylyltransferase